MIDAIQKQVDVHFKEICKLRSVQNSHVPVSRLPAELLSEAFLCIVESSLQYGSLGFAEGTFAFRQVCRHWDEVAVGFPQLWVQWVSRAVRAWSLFNTHSKEAPIFLTWQPYQSSIIRQDLPADTVIPGRVHQLDFSGTREQSEQLFRALDSNAPSNVSSIRVYIIPYGARQDNGQGTQENLTRFLSSPFPKLSKLHITNYQLDSSSTVFTTSNLISLKLSFPHGTRPCYTLSQVLGILRKHPNLRELDLEDAATQQVELTEALVPFTLPQLVDLKLRGTPGYIFRLVSLIGLTSPLHSTALHFDYTRDQDGSALVDTVKNILSAYYECKGLDHPRKANYLSVTGPRFGPLFLAARSRSTPASSPQPLLELRFCRTHELPKILPLLPLKDTQEFAINALVLSSDGYHRLLLQLKGISELQLSRLDIGPVLEALDPRKQGASKGATEISCWVVDTCADDPGQQLVPKLVSLTLSNLDFLHGMEEDILDVLRGRRDNNIGLERLIIRSCRVHRAHDDEGYFKGLVEEVKWVDVENVGTEYEGYSDEDSDWDESDF